MLEHDGVRKRYGVALTHLKARVAKPQSQLLGRGALYPQCCLSVPGSLFLAVRMALSVKSL